MNLNDFLSNLANDPQSIAFTDTMAVIDNNTHLRHRVLIIMGWLVVLMKIMVHVNCLHLLLIKN